MLFTIATQNKPQTPNAQIAAVQRFQQSDFKDRASLETLIDSNIRLVIKIAKSYERHGCELEDLVSEGTIGIINAAQRWEAEHGANFTTYAQQWIRAAIQEYVQKNSSAFKVGGRTVRTLFQSLARVMRENGGIADASLIAKELNLDEAEVAYALRYMNRQGKALDAPVGPEGRPFHDMIGDDSLSAEEALIAKEENQTTDDLFLNFAKGLSEREQVIYFDRMLADNPVGLVQLGEVFGISAERVRQIEAVIFSKLQKAARKA
jgi:RNA polymerase sigma-32 factor